MKTARVTIKLLREFTVDTPQWGVTDLSKRMSLDKATVHRLLRALCDEGIVEQDEATKKYGLTLAILNLAASRLKSLGFVEQASDEMRRLRETINESVVLHVRDGYDVVCVHSNESTHQLTVRFVLGERSPIHLVAGGLVHLAAVEPAELEALLARAIAAHPNQPQPDVGALLAAVEHARTNKTAVTDEVFQRGLRGISTGIFDGRGAILGSLSIVSPTSRVSLGELKEFAPRLMQSAAGIARKLQRL